MSDINQNEIDELAKSVNATTAKPQEEINPKSAKLMAIISTVVTFCIMVVLSIAWLTPIFLIVMNSFKKKLAIREGKGMAFELLTKDSFTGWSNYVEGAEKVGMRSAIINSVLITVFAVICLVLLTSMAAWFITRVKTKYTTFIYFLFVFSMVVPFQMVMYTMSSIANMLHLNSVPGLIVLYVGFGAGMCVFMFSGFVKAIPFDVEEAAMIDGCTPLQTFFRIVLPMLKPTCITVAILETMWIWNDYLLPKLILPTEVKTIPIAIDACTGSHGVKNLGWLMAMLVIAIVPIIVFYLLCQKHIIKGVAAGAVKG